MSDETEHAVHLYLTDEDVQMYFSMLEERIRKYDGLIKRTINNRIECVVKMDMSMAKHQRNKEIVENLFNEMKEQTAW